MSKTISVRRFRVALSFSGNERSYVEEVAEKLADYFDKNEVFYDKYYRAELARIDLDTYLQNIYLEDSDLIVLFFSDSYENKMWCGLEWRAIRNLITKRPNHIVPIKMSSSSPPKGLFNIDGYLLGYQLRSTEIANDIITRYSQEFSNSTQPVKEIKTEDPNHDLLPIAKLLIEPVLFIPSDLRSTKSDHIQIAESLLLNIKPDEKSFEKENLSILDLYYFMSEIYINQLCSSLCGSVFIPYISNNLDSMSSYWASPDELKSGFNSEIRGMIKYIDTDESVYKSLMKYLSPVRNALPDWQHIEKFDNALWNIYLLLLAIHNKCSVRLTTEMIVEGFMSINETELIGSLGLKREAASRISKLRAILNSFCPKENFPCFVINPNVSVGELLQRVDEIISDKRFLEASTIINSYTSSSNKQSLKRSLLKLMRSILKVSSWAKDTFFIGSETITSFDSTARLEDTVSEIVITNDKILYNPVILPPVEQTPNLFPNGYMQIARRYWKYWGFRSEPIGFSTCLQIELIADWGERPGYVRKNI